MEREDLIYSNEHSTSVTFLTLCYNYFKYKTVVLLDLDLRLEVSEGTHLTYMWMCIFCIAEK